MSNGMMVSNRNYVHRSTSGYVITFVANEPTYVPPVVRREVMGLGILPVDSDPSGLEAAEDINNRALVISGDLRAAILFTVIEIIAKRNKTTDFDAAGRPKEYVICKMSGLTVRTQERNNLWEHYKSCLGNKEEVPSHKDAPLYFKLLDVSTIEELNKYAAQLGIEANVLANYSFSEGKKILIHKLVAG